MQPLADMDVLDLTQSIAGPVCTQMLATMGADVVKVEPPGGDAFRGVVDGAMFASYNLDGKRSLCVNLKTDEGQAIVRELAERADVIVESFRPGVLSKFDLDYASVAATNEDVVYCSVTGFGQEGPYSDRPAYDPVVQAMSGLMSVIGYPDRPPVRIGASVTDCGTGANAAFMIVSALMDRFRHDQGGEHIDISLFDTALSWMAYWIANYTGTGEVPQRAGSGFAGLAPNSVYATGDDEMIYLCTVNDEQYERVCRAIDRPDLLADERYETNENRWANRDALREDLEEAFAAYDRESLVDILTDAGVPAGPLRTVDEVAEEDPQVKARHMLVESHNVAADRDVETARLPIRTVDWLPDVAGDPPTCGEHTREILAELGYDGDRVDSLLEADVVAES